MPGGTQAITGRGNRDVTVTVTVTQAVTVSPARAAAQSRYRLGPGHSIESRVRQQLTGIMMKFKLSSLAIRARSSDFMLKPEERVTKFTDNSSCSSQR